MPLSAIEALEQPDFISSKDSITKEIAKLIGSPSIDTGPAPELLVLENQIAVDDRSSIGIQQRMGKQVPMTCPSCQGPLWELHDKRIERFRCHTGHGYSLKSLANAQAHHLENSMWAALRVLEEHIRVMKKSASGKGVTTRALENRIKEHRNHANTFKDFLLQLRKDQGKESF
jgi:two-component system chemotaxis response regulator CheB